MLIDTHCHLHDREFFTEEQAEAMLKNAFRAGVKKIICIGTDLKDSLAAREFAEAHENVYWTYGVHPENATKELNISNSGPRPAGAKSPTEALRNAPKLDIFSSERPVPRKVVSGPLVAIGEVGLDYHYEGYDREAQIKLFEEMLQLAHDNDLPVSFHVREAFDDFFAVTKNFPDVKGVVHSFTDSKKILKRVLNETDYFVGVNGLATYSTLPTPPLERILLETDAPFLTPKPFRGIINESAYVREIAVWLSEKLGTEFETVERETTNNAKRLFKF